MTDEPVAPVDYWVEVTIDGNRLGDEWEARLVRVVVDDNLQFPAMFELTFLDPEQAGFGGTGLAIGASVTIQAASGRGSETLLSGEVAALEGEFDVLGSTLVARGYDKSHRLHGGRKTRAWLEKSDADVVREIAGEAGVATGSVEDTGYTHPYLVQADLSDWDFLRSRARAVGYDLAVRDGQLDFAPPTESSDAPSGGSYSSLGSAQLVFGLNLRSFRPRVSAAEQVTSVETRGWDPAQKQAVTSTANAKTRTASIDGNNGPSALAGNVGGRTYVTTAEPFSASSEAKLAADAIAERIGSASIEAEGTATGHPGLRAGTAVSIAKASAPFNGNYVLTATRHVFDLEGYVTHFVVSGRQERSLLGLTSAGLTNAEANAPTPLQGVVVGLVTDVGDPNNEGRVKVKLPALSDDYATDWCRVAYVGAGGTRGLFVVPEVNDEVLVAFAHGDPRQPYVLGSLYNGQDKPPDAASAVSGGEVKKRVLTSRLGHVVELRDDDSDSGLMLKASGEKIDLRAGDKKITITSGGDVEITGTGDVTISATGALTLKGGTKVELSAPTVKLSGDGGLELATSGDLQLKGTNTTLKGEAMLNVQSSGIAQIQGSLVKIN